jgi:GT2 family glycosyltransferase
LYLEEFIVHEKLRMVGCISVINPEGVIVHKHGRATSTVSRNVVKTAELASLRYYLIHYRYYNKLIVNAIIIYIYWRPKKLIEIFKKK